MANRCWAPLVSKPGNRKGEPPIRRCGSLAAGNDDYCPSHRGHRLHFDALRRALGAGWETRVEGGTDPLTPRNGWKAADPAPPATDAPAPLVPDADPFDAARTRLDAASRRFDTARSRVAPTSRKG